MAEALPAAEAAPVEAAPAEAAPVEAVPAEAAAADAAPVDSAKTPAAESASVESQPSLLSSAEGAKAPEPAPSTEVTATEAAPDRKDPAAKDKDQPKAETKAEDKGAVDPATKDATPKEAPAPLSITDLTLPEGVTLEAEGSKVFVDLMNNAELSSKDRAQGLIDLHRAELERVYAQVSDNQRRVWDDLNAGWRDQLRKDAEIGGNRLHTNLSKAKGMIEEHLSPDDATALLRHVDTNGMGNYPPFIRLLVKLADRLNVFEDGMVISNPAPARPQRGPGTRGWYDKT
jgi:hypothetical protein